ncbi:MAG: 6-carboxytetrahydropterin synthase [Proteobacteria bacterium]|nr:6-carboxytetrahydropterin synthase [Pseudomonadota bacterium]
MSRQYQAAIEKKFLYVTQEVSFCAAHKLYRSEMSLEQNVALFGKCANPHGHGHNFTLQATFKGELDSLTGMVIDFAKAKQILEDIVVAPLDHKNMNEDIPFLKGIIPTSENVVLLLWEQIQKATQAEPWALMKLKLASSLHHWVEYFGPEHL